MGSLTLTRTINPGVAIGANTRAGGNFNQSDYNVLRNSNDPANVARWAGSAIVSTLNNTDVAVVNFNIRPDSNVAAGNGGVGIKRFWRPNLPAFGVQDRHLCQRRRSRPELAQVLDHPHPEPDDQQRHKRHYLLLQPQWHSGASGDGLEYRRW
jgi:hypothetical protein